MAGAAGPLNAEAEGVRARKGSSHPGLRFPRGLSSSKRALPGGERSSGVLGVEKEAPGEDGGAPRGARRSPGGLPVVRARGARPALSPSSRPPPPMMAGSRLRVWRSLRLERFLAAGAAAAAAGEEQEKTLLSRLCADIAAAAAPRPPDRCRLSGRRVSRPVPSHTAPGFSPRRRGPTAAPGGSWRRPGLLPPPPRSLCWEGRGKGGRKKKKKVTREKGREGGSGGAFISARRSLPESLPPRPRRAREPLAVPPQPAGSPGPPAFPPRGGESRCRGGCGGAGVPSPPAAPTEPRGRVFGEGSSGPGQSFFGAIVPEAQPGKVPARPGQSAAAGSGTPRVLPGHVGGSRCLQGTLPAIGGVLAVSGTRLRGYRVFGGDQPAVLVRPPSLFVPV